MELWRGDVLLRHLQGPVADPWEQGVQNGTFKPAAGWEPLAPLFAREVLLLGWADRNDASWVEWKQAASDAQGPGVVLKATDGSQIPVFLRIDGERAQTRCR